jgi:hypothetical protein
MSGGVAGPGVVARADQAAGQRGAAFPCVDPIGTVRLTGAVAGGKHTLSVHAW